MCLSYVQVHVNMVYLGKWVPVSMVYRRKWAKLQWYCRNEKRVSPLVSISTSAINSNAGLLLNRMLSHRPIAGEKDMMRSVTRYQIRHMPGVTQDSNPDQICTRCYARQ